MMEIDTQYCSVWYKNLITLFIQINNEYRFTAPEKNHIECTNFLSVNFENMQEITKGTFYFST